MTDLLSYCKQYTLYMQYMHAYHTYLQRLCYSLKDINILYMYAVENVRPLHWSGFFFHRIRKNSQYQWSFDGNTFLTFNSEFEQFCLRMRQNCQWFFRNSHKTIVDFLKIVLHIEIFNWSGNYKVKTQYYYSLAFDIVACILDVWHNETINKFTIIKINR